MSTNMDTMVVGQVDVCDVGSHEEINTMHGAAPSGNSTNLSSNSNDGGNDHHNFDCDKEVNADRKKKRRRKAKRKVPYSTQSSGRPCSNPRSSKRVFPRVRKHPDAPYNSNRFLIEDHNDLKDFDENLLAQQTAKAGENNQSLPPRGRVRDSSFTSVDTDDDFFYSSPEDEEEFLTKEFSNAYNDLRMESLAALSKTELMQYILQLEEKLDKVSRSGTSTSPPASTEDNAGNEKYQEEMSELALVNKELLKDNTELLQENALLKKKLPTEGTDMSGSSEDSESDSSSSSCSSSSSSDEEMVEPSVRQNGPTSENDLEPNLILQPTGPTPEDSDMTSTT